MILKLTVVSLCIVLIAVITISYYVNKEGFENLTVKKVWDKIVPPNTPGLKWSDMNQICESKGKRLCKSNEMCVNGNPLTDLDTFGAVDNWFAVGDATNEWQTYNRADNRLCKTHTQVAKGVPGWGETTTAGGFNRAVKCCDKPTVAPVVPAPAPMKPVEIIPDGTTVSCNSGDQTYYFEKGVLHLYPSHSIAQSWDPINFMKPKIIDCSMYKIGSPMDRKDATNPSIENPMTNKPYNPIPKIINSDPFPAPISDSLPASKGARPTRNDIAPQVSISDIGYNAMEKQQRSDLIRDIQTIVKNELLSDRATQHVSQMERGPFGPMDSAAISQGREHSRNSYKSEDSDCEDGSDEPDRSDEPDGPNGYNGFNRPNKSNRRRHDMSKYIKKDAIPCWGCSLDY